MRLAALPKYVAVPRAPPVETVSASVEGVPGEEANLLHQLKM
jgi:hypothetical protein